MLPSGKEVRSPSQSKLWVHRFSWSLGATCGSAKRGWSIFQVFSCLPFLYFLFSSSLFFLVQFPLFKIHPICSRLAHCCLKLRVPHLTRIHSNLRLRSIHRIPSALQQGPLPDSSDVLPFSPYGPYCMLINSVDSPHFCNSSALHCPGSTCSQFLESLDSYHCP